ncbi:hypothetical protein SMD44_07758 [Streptomyces alboflavus]|uniref:Uncharacterized protein n=1 Tax=Streptomyces alboflavus TaxID=67267 RepID=A0A1Z1WP84_9ACTN|nr:hypothetical protein [Streptomyces alboflavus]ARX88271.1 hypothetical protein SMD44_07758 [Streptomyces alboflavus]
MSSLLAISARLGSVLASERQWCRRAAARRSGGRALEVNHEEARAESTDAYVVEVAARPATGIGNEATELAPQVIDPPHAALHGRIRPYGSLRSAAAVRGAFVVLSTSQPPDHPGQGDHIEESEQHDKGSAAPLGHAQEQRYDEGHDAWKEPQPSPAA